MALAGWHSWLKRHSIDQNVTGLIPRQSTTQVVVSTANEGTYEKAANRCFSLSLSLPPLSL